MTRDAGLVLTVLVACTALFVSELLPLEVVALGVVLALMLGGVLTPAEALAGFGEPVVITVGALFVVGAAIVHTGLASGVAVRLGRLGRGSEARLVALVMSAAAVLSAFMSSTGTVAVLLPAVLELSRRGGVAPARLLMPLAMGSLLGGMLTLIGTPPNLIVSRVLVERGGAPLSFFAFTPPGALILLVSVAWMSLLGRRLLPQGQVLPGDDGAQGTAALLPGRVLRLRVRGDGPAAGRTVSEALPRSRTGVTVLGLRRDDGPWPWSGLQPVEAHTPLGAGDLLVVHGETSDVARLVEAGGLAPAGDEEGASHPESPDAEAPGLAEVLLTPRSRLIGRTLAELRFRDQFGLNVLAILRQGAPVRGALAELPLAFGDGLLLHGPRARIALLAAARRDLVVLGEDLLPGDRARGAWRAALIVGLMLLLMATSLVPVVAAALLAALALILARCLTLEEAYRGMSWSSLVLIAGLLPLAQALQRTGLAAQAVEGLVTVLGPLGPLGVLGGLFLVTSLLSQVISNTATTVVVAPIAFQAAQSLQLSPRAALLAVALAASTAFSTPVASPVNTLVMVPGGYRFRDYLRAGVPLQLLALLCALLVLPWLG